MGRIVDVFLNKEKRDRNTLKHVYIETIICWKNTISLASF